MVGFGSVLQTCVEIVTGLVNLLSLFQNLIRGNHQCSTLKHGSVQFWHHNLVKISPEIRTQRSCGMNFVALEKISSDRNYP